MNQIKIDMLVVGPIRTNCYIINNTTTKEAVIVDPGDQATVIINKIHEMQLKPKAILLTHGHFDHIMAGTKVASEFGVKIYAGQQEKALVENVDLNCSVMFGKPFSLFVNEVLKDHQKLNLLGTTIEVIETPGHTVGSVCYYLADEGILISGDTLFFESYGRTDLPTGNEENIILSLRERLLILPENVKVYPGHGSATSIGYEKKNNPYA